MADTRAATGLTVQQWDSEFFSEYLQENRFAGEMGTDEASIIQLKEDLTKKPGDSVTFALVNKLTNDATTGSAVLEGNEEDLTSRSFRLYVDKRRHAIRVSEMEEQKSAIGLRNAGKAQLKVWAEQDTIGLIIDALGSLNGTNFASRTAAIGDAWLVDNLDRVYFGANVGSGTDLSSDLSQLDTTNDLFNKTALEGMISKAKKANPKIRPVRDPGNGRRYYIVYAGIDAFKDFRASMEGLMDDTTAQGQSSKLFEGGDLIWQGCIVKEIDEIPVYANLGASATTEVTPVYLCGAQALGMAFARRWKTVEKKFDYDDKAGVAIDQIYGIKKLLFGSGSADTDDLKDNGVVTGFFATTGAATVTAPEL